MYAKTFLWMYIKWDWSAFVGVVNCWLFSSMKEHKSLTHDELLLQYKVTSLVKKITFNLNFTETYPSHIVL